MLVVTDSNGTEHKFEQPSFECELLKVVDNKIVGYLLLSGGIYPCYWDTEGKCWRQNDTPDIKEFNLTPTLEWYEIEDNFPCHITNGEGHQAILTYGSGGIGYDTRDMQYKLKDNTNWRLATKEEVLSVYYKGKE